MKSFDWRMPNFKMLVLSVERLQRISSRRLLIGEGSAEKVAERLKGVFEADGKTVVAQQRARELLNHSLDAAYQDLAPRSNDEEFEELFTLGLVTYLRYVFAHMRSCLTGALLSALFLLLAVRTYAFEPKQLVSVALGTALLVAVAVILWTFVQMDRNASLSAIGNTMPGQVSFDRHFLSNVLTYGVLPVTGLLVTQFPALGQALVGWLDPLLQVVGAG